MLAVAFKWTPGMEGYLRAMSVPVWTVLIFYLGKSPVGLLRWNKRDSEEKKSKMYKLDNAF